MDSLSLVLIGALIVIGLNHILTLYKLLKFKNAFTNYEKEVKKVFDAINTNYKQAELLGSVKERFKQFQELTNQQQNLLGQVDRPSASASHSKFKNTMIGELKALEEQKRVILRSILEDGIDVHIQMMDSQGNKTKMKISDHLNGDVPPETSPEKTESKSPQGNVKKLQLVKSEEIKDEPDDTTIH